MLPAAPSPGSSRTPQVVRPARGAGRRASGSAAGGSPSGRRRRGWWRPPSPSARTRVAVLLGAAAGEAQHPSTARQQAAGTRHIASIRQQTPADASDGACWVGDGGTRSEPQREEPHDRRTEHHAQQRCRDPSARLRGLPDPAREDQAATLAALEVGYRHIDTAEMYGNEKEVGAAVRASGIDRGEIFVTSKLNNGFQRPTTRCIAFDRTLDDLDLGYLDLFLIHWPLPRVGRLRRDLEGDGGDLRRRRGPGHRRVQLPGRDHLRRLPRETTWCRRSTRSRSIPT